MTNTAASTTTQVLDGPDTSTLLIDVDVHERPPAGLGMTDLIPYIDPHWQRFLKGEGGVWHGLGKPQTYAAPIATNGVREDWNSPGGIVGGGTSIDAMRKHLFEGEDVSIAILQGPLFYPSEMHSDPEFATALAAADNDYQIEHWLEPEPRLRGSVHVAAQEPDNAAYEIDRASEHPQIVQVVLPLSTSRQWGEPFYRPIWEAAVRNDLVVTFHHGHNTKTLLGFPRYYIEWHTMAAPQAAQNQVMSLIANGVFDKYPELKVVVCEGGVTWVHWLMWRMDQQFRELRQNIPWVKRLPSEHIRSNVRVGMQPMTEVTTKEFQQLVEMTQTEGVYVVSTDYPHYDADSAKAVLPGTLPEDLRMRIRYRNALETYPRLRGLV